jgi:hypothetical protein
MMGRTGDHPSPPRGKRQLPAGGSRFRRVQIRLRDRELQALKLLEPQLHGRDRSDTIRRLIAAHSAT